MFTGNRKLTSSATILTRKRSHVLVMGSGQCNRHSVMAVGLQCTGPSYPPSVSPPDQSLRAANCASLPPSLPPVRPSIWRHSVIYDDGQATKHAPGIANPCCEKQSLLVDLVTGMAVGYPATVWSSFVIHRKQRKKPQGNVDM